ncbi:lysophospholipid acyltransferase 6 [Neocloeon triangulifer]|uniref:lysophospholipid acyltransferase 6 n=1 Tax=Neocloeon triangulifer TaxID=2078957 RepID=UPI00286F784D|nr:lysophospholipid acyltransferase 6 [Neocloeon triangulifer]XP_059484322.1 lysophospholipid acyltransferase 6 [Neocloeon triangulifer]
MAEAAFTPEYSGSKLLAPLSHYCGLPLDQINFVAGLVCALLLAPFLRTFLHPAKVSATTRHRVCLLFGIALSWFCYGKRTIHILGMPTICYIMMKVQGPTTAHRTVLFISLVYLSLIHLYHQFIEKNFFSVDVTGPMMVVTQKVTSLAYSLHDGNVEKKEKLKPMQALHAIKNLPSPLEYFSFVLQFQTILAGPLVLYNDYHNYIHGVALAECQSLASQGNNSKFKDSYVEPSPMKAVLNKVAGSIFCLVFFLWMIPLFPIGRVKDAEFLTTKGVPAQILYLIVATSLVRLKYYHAWLLADAISNASGLGLRVPTNPKEQPTWDLISNIDVIGFESGTSLRDSVSAWNKGTSTWLRLLVYERNTKMRTLQTYILSAIWHGFHPGYYLTFLSGALFTVAARSARRCLRHHFTGSIHYKQMYDWTTFLATRVLMGYVTFPFVLLEFWPCIRIYSHMYWWYHLLAAAAIMILPVLMPTAPSDSKTGKAARTQEEVKLAAGLEDQDGDLILVPPPNLSPSARRRHLLRDVVLADSGKMLKLNSTALVTE